MKPKSVAPKPDPLSRSPSGTAFHRTSSRPPTDLHEPPAPHRAPFSRAATHHTAANNEADRAFLDQLRQELQEAHKLCDRVLVAQSVENGGIPPGGLSPVRRSTYASLNHTRSSLRQSSASPMPRRVRSVEGSHRHDAVVTSMEWSTSSQSAPAVGASVNVVEMSEVAASPSPQRAVDELQRKVLDHLSGFDQAMFDALDAKGSLLADASMLAARRTSRESFTKLKQLSDAIIAAQNKQRTMSPPAAVGVASLPTAP